MLRINLITVAHITLFAKSVLFAALMVFFSTSCRGSGPVCGNGIKEKGENCDCGTDPEKIPEGCRAINGAPRSTCSDNCTLLQVQYTTLVVSWTLNGENENGGTFDTCSDIGISEMHIGIQGPLGFSADKSSSCAAYQDSWYESNTVPLDSGEYTVTATPLQNRQPVGEPQMGSGTVNIDQTTNIRIDFPLDTFHHFESMTGDLLLSYTFGGDDCEDASPVVATEKISVFQEDVLLEDFPKTRTCSNSAWIHNTLPVGETLVRLEGWDSEDASGFCIEELVKIGAGGNLPFMWSIPPVSEGSCQGP